MKSAEVFQRLWRKLELCCPSPSNVLRKFVWQLRGAEIGHGTRLPQCWVTWPHQVRIGSHCRLGRGIFYNFSHYWIPGPSIIIGDNVVIGGGVEFNCRCRIEIADDCLIAAGCRFIDSDHGMALGQNMREQENSCAPIKVGKNAWIGANAIVLKGVTIGSGAVVGAGALVRESVGDNEIWAGVPARKVGIRRSSDGS